MDITSLLNNFAYLSNLMNVKKVVATVGTAMGLGNYII